MSTHTQQSVPFTSWQTSLRKRFSHGLTGSLNYTWGKGLSTAGGDIGAYYQGDGDARAQQFLYPRNDRGPNTGDIKSYFNAEWVYEVPQLLKQGRMAKSVFGGWQLSGILQARTGEPVSLAQTGALQINRPDYNGGQVYFDNYRETLQYLNRAAFTLVPLGTVSRAPERPGNVGNGAIRAPGSVNLDFSIGKSVPITETAKIQIRADMFNSLQSYESNRPAQ